MAPEDVEQMRRLRALGWTAARLAARFGCSRTTVHRHCGGGRRITSAMRDSVRAMLANGAHWRAVTHAHGIGSLATVAKILQEAPPRLAA